MVLLLIVIGLVAFIVIATTRLGMHPFLNSCALRSDDLICAASNYPNLPMASSVEIFDRDRLVHVRTHSFGPYRGSLTWFDWHEGSWWGGFANYDNRGGEPGRGHQWTTLVRFDEQFRETGAWLFPQSVLSRFAPYSNSGGAWGSDGLLYVTGHDRRELYVVQIPRAGSTLVHVATIGLVTEGQAIDWDPAPGRLLWSIDRKNRNAVLSEVPAVAAIR